MEDFEKNKKMLDAICRNGIAISIENSGTLKCIKIGSTEYNDIISGKSHIETISIEVSYSGLFWFDIESRYDIETDFSNLYDDVAENADELDESLVYTMWNGYVDFVDEKLSMEYEEFSDEELYDNYDEIIESSKTKIKDILTELVDEVK